MFSVAEGGELCLTSGDHREPEDRGIYITSSPRSALPSEGKRRVESVPFSSGSLRSPEVKHDSPPSATPTTINAHYTIKALTLIIRTEH